MSMKDIEKLIFLFKKLRDSFQSGDKQKIAISLDKLSISNNDILKNAEEFKILWPFTLSLTKKISTSISAMRSHLDKPKKCVNVIDRWIKRLKNIEYQPKVLKQLVKKFVKPIFKEWKFKRKGGNTFQKEEGRYTKIFNIQSSQWNNFENVNFTFNLSILQGRKTLSETRLGILKTRKDNWYLLTPEIDYKKLGKEVQEDILKYAKKYFEGPWKT